MRSIFLRADRYCIYIYIIYIKYISILRSIYIVNLRGECTNSKINGSYSNLGGFIGGVIFKWLENERRLLVSKKITSAGGRKRTHPLEGAWGPPWKKLRYRISVSRGLHATAHDLKTGTGDGPEFSTCCGYVLSQGGRAGRLKCPIFSIPPHASIVLVMTTGYLSGRGLARLFAVSRRCQCSQQPDQSVAALISSGPERDKCISGQPYSLSRISK